MSAESWHRYMKNLLRRETKQQYENAQADEWLAKPFSPRTYTIVERLIDDFWNEALGA